MVGFLQLYELFQIRSWSAVLVETWICYERGAWLAVPERDIYYISYIYLCIDQKDTYMKWNDEMKTHHLFKSQDSKPCEVKTQQMSRGIDGLHIRQSMAIWPP